MISANFPLVQSSLMLEVLLTRLLQSCFDWIEPLSSLIVIKRHLQLITDGVSYICTTYSVTHCILLMAWRLLLLKPHFEDYNLSDDLHLSILWTSDPTLPMNPTVTVSTSAQHEFLLTLHIWSLQPK